MADLKSVVTEYLAQKKKLQDVNDLLERLAQQEHKTYKELCSSTLFDDETALYQHIQSQIDTDLKKELLQLIDSSLPLSTMHDFKKCIIEYLQGISNLTKTLSSLEEIANRSRRSCKDLSAHIPIMKSDGQFIRALLLTLRVPSDEYAKYNDEPNILSLLTLLRDDDHGALDYLLDDLIAKVTPVGSLVPSMLRMATVSSAATIYSYYNPKFVDQMLHVVDKMQPLMFSWCQTRLIPAIPIMNIAGHIVLLSYYVVWDLYCAHTSRATKNTERSNSRFYNLIFNTLAAICTIIAYTFLFMTLGIMTPIAGGLLLSGSLITLLQQIWNYNHLPSCDALAGERDGAWYAAEARVILDNRYNAAKSAILPETLASIANVIAVAVWVLLPFSWGVSLCCTLTCSLIELAKQQWLNSDRIAYEGQRNRARKEHEHEIELNARYNYQAIAQIAFATEQVIKTQRITKREKDLIAKESELQTGQQQFAEEKAKWEQEKQQREKLIAVISYYTIDSALKNSLSNFLAKAGVFSEKKISPPPISSNNSAASTVVNSFDKNNSSPGNLRSRENSSNNSVATIDNDNKAEIAYNKVAAEWSMTFFKLPRAKSEPQNLHLHLFLTHKKPN